MTLTPKLPVLEASSCSLGLVVYCKPRPPHPSISGILQGVAGILNELLSSSCLGVVGFLPICPTAGEVGSAADVTIDN